MSTNSNIIIKTILEMMGDPQQHGGYLLPVGDKNVPVKLSKDGSVSYPEIRLSPFLSNNENYNYRYYEKSLRDRTEYRNGTFQIDIFSKTLVEANNIYEILKERIYEYTHLEVLQFNYNKYFQKIGEYTYKNISYVAGKICKEIYYVKINDIILTRVKSQSELTENTFYPGSDALYIKLNDITEPNLKSIIIGAITQGRLFNNKDSISNRGIITIDIGSTKNLNELENNEVQRVSFDINAFYGKTYVRDKIPTIDKIFSRSEVYGNR